MMSFWLMTDRIKSRGAADAVWFPPASHECVLRVKISNFCLFFRSSNTKTLPDCFILLPGV